MIPTLVLVSFHLRKSKIREGFPALSRTFAETKSIKSKTIAVVRKQSKDEDIQKKFKKLKKKMKKIKEKFKSNER